MIMGLQWITGLNARRVAAAALAYALLALPSATHGASAPNEEVLKAAFLYNFAQFTRWPATMPANRPITFCLYEDGMPGEAGMSLGGKAIGGRATMVQRFEGGELPQDCDVLYVALDYGEERVCMLSAAGAARGMLTVSDMEGFDVCGGHITLTTINNRLRFVVNLQAVQAGGLTLSAQLLELAIVR